MLPESEVLHSIINSPCFQELALSDLGTRCTHINKSNKLIISTIKHQSIKDILKRPEHKSTNRKEKKGWDKRTKEKYINSVSSKKDRWREEILLIEQK